MLAIFNHQNLLRHLRQQFQIDWWGHHGIAHWARVRANGLMLASQTDANRHVVELFAYFHDSRRINEHQDEGHGVSGAQLAKHLKGKFFDATDHEIDLLCYACEHHSDGMIQADPTVQTCWDADRLDLGRVGIIPKARYLCTEAARTEAVMARANRRAQTWRDTYDAKHDRN